MSNKSIVWKFFHVKPEDKRMSVCELCPTDTEVARGPAGSTAKSWNTRNLLNHLETHHKHELAAEKPVHEKERLTKQYENPTPSFQKNRLQQAAL